jgi:hypothetical protein
VQMAVLPNLPPVGQPADPLRPVQPTEERRSNNPLTIKSRGRSFRIEIANYWLIKVYGTAGRVDGINIGYTLHRVAVNVCNLDVVQLSIRPNGVQIDYDGAAISSEA